MAVGTLVLVIIGIIAVGLVILAIGGIIAYITRRDTTLGRDEPAHTDTPSDYVPTPGKFDPRAQDQPEDPEKLTQRKGRTE